MIGIGDAAGLLDEPAQRAQVRQGEIAGTLGSRHWQTRPADDTSPSPILRRVAQQQPGAHRLEGFNLSAPILAAPSAEWGSPDTS
jgi:hypothetical protein